MPPNTVKAQHFLTPEGVEYMGRFSVIPAYCLTDNRLSPRDLTVLSALGIHANKSGYATPSLSTLGKYLGITRQAVQKSINHLIKIGYVESTKRTRDNGSQTSNQYRILFDAGCDESHQRVKDFIHEGEQPEVAGVQPQVAGGATSEVAGGATSEVAPRSPQEKSPTELKDMFGIPDWLDKGEWEAFSECRKKMKAPLTSEAAKRLIKKLDEFRKQGHDPNTILSTSIENGWKGVFPPKGVTQQPQQGNGDNRPHYAKEFR